MNLVIVSVGSNIEPLKNINKAADILADMNCLISVSGFVKTRPVGFTDQPDFLNGSFYISTSLNQPELKNKLREIELELGRIRTANKNDPRTIDLDIVVFNGDIVDPDYYRYPFVQTSVDEIFKQIRRKKWRRKIQIA